MRKYFVNHEGLAAFYEFFKAPRGPNSLYNSIGFFVRC